jgi:hypothetical protein
MREIRTYGSVRGSVEKGNVGSMENLSLAGATHIHRHQPFSTALYSTEIE